MLTHTEFRVAMIFRLKFDYNSHFRLDSIDIEDLRAPLSRNLLIVEMMEIVLTCQSVILIQRSENNSEWGSIVANKEFC